MSTVTDQDLLSPELTEDPFAYFAELRATDPVHWAEANKAWLLTRYDDVVAAFGDPRLSSDRVRPLLDVLPAQRRAEYGPMLEIIGRWMVVTDPPAHTRLRKLANHAFRQQRISAMSGWIGELVDELLDDFVAAGERRLPRRHRLPAAGRGHRPDDGRAAAGPGQVPALVRRTRPGRVQRRRPGPGQPVRPRAGRGP